MCVRDGFDDPYRTYAHARKIRRQAETRTHHLTGLRPARWDEEPIADQLLDPRLQRAGLILEDMLEDNHTPLDRRYEVERRRDGQSNHEPG